MNGFDHYLENSYSFCRFSDNINLYFETREEAVIALPVIESYLKETYFLDLNQEKSGIYLAMNRNFLGYTFQYSKDKSKVLIFKDKKEKNQNPSRRLHLLRMMPARRARAARRASGSREKSVIVRIRLFSMSRTAAGSLADAITR